MKGGKIASESVFIPIFFKLNYTVIQTKQKKDYEIGTIWKNKSRYQLRGEDLKQKRKKTSNKFSNCYEKIASKH